MGIITEMPVVAVPNDMCAVITTSQSRRAVMSTNQMELVRHDTHLVVVLHDGPLPSRRVHPSDEVLLSTGDEHSWIGDRLGADSDMALLDRTNRLRSELAWELEDSRRRTSETVSAIFRRATTTASRLRAKDETVTLFSMSLGLDPTSGGQQVFPNMRSGKMRRGVPRIPMSYNLLSISASFCCRNGSSAGSIDSRWIKDRKFPQSLLYLLMSNEAE